MIKLTMLAMAIAFTGCASDGGSMGVGSHGQDSTLSDNDLEGLYLFKIDTQNNVITIHSGGKVELKL